VLAEEGTLITCVASNAILKQFDAIGTSNVPGIILIQMKATGEEKVNNITI